MSDALIGVGFLLFYEKRDTRVAVSLQKFYLVFYARPSLFFVGENGCRPLFYAGKIMVATTFCVGFRLDNYLTNTKLISVSFLQLYSIVL